MENEECRTLHSALPTLHLKGPPAGAAPARLSYKGSLQAAARRQNGLPSRSSKSKGWPAGP